MQDKFVLTSFGRIHFHHGGSGPPLILLHSNGGSAFDFEQVTQKLAEKFELFVWDMPGQGDSDPLTRHLGVYDYTDILISFMDALRLERASIVGVSIGGSMCIALGARYAARIKTLYIVEAPCRTEAEWVAQWPRIEANFAQPVQDEATVAPRVKAIQPGFMQRWNIDRCKAGAKTMMSVMWALREYDTFTDLPHLPPGAVVIFGDQGPTIAGKDKFCAGLAAPNVEIMAGCGHFPMFDAPDAFCDIIQLYHQQENNRRETAK